MGAAHGLTGHQERAPAKLVNVPMYQDIIGSKRASLYPAQRPRNGFCSTSGRPETTVDKGGRSTIRPESGKGCDFNTDAMRVRIYVWLGQTDPERADSPEGGDALEDRMRKRLLEIVAASRGDLGNLRAEEIIIPSACRIVAGRRSEILEPDLDADKEALRRADLELVKADVSLDGERFEKDSS